MSASRDVPEHGESPILDTPALAGYQCSPVKWVTVRVIM